MSSQNVPIHFRATFGKSKLDQGIKAGLQVQFYLGSIYAQEKLIEAQNLTNGIAKEKKVTILIPVEGEASDYKQEFQDALDSLESGPLLGMVAGLVDRKVHASGQNIILEVSIAVEQYVEMVEGFLSQVEAMAGSLIQHKSNLSIKINSSHTPGDIIKSDNMILKLLEGFELEVCADIKQEFRKQAFDMFENMLPPPALPFVGPAILFEGVNWEFNFSSVADLPQKVREIAEDNIKQENFKQIIQMINLQYTSLGEIPETNLINLLKKRAKGIMKVFVNTPVGAAVLEINAPGISSVLG